MPLTIALALGTALQLYQSAAAAVSEGKAKEWQSAIQSTLDFMPKWLWTPIVFVVTAFAISFFAWRESVSYFDKAKTRIDAAEATPYMRCQRVKKLLTDQARKIEARTNDSELTDVDIARWSFDACDLVNAQIIGRQRLEITGQINATGARHHHDCAVTHPSETKAQYDARFLYQMLSHRAGELTEHDIAG